MSAVCQWAWLGRVEYGAALALQHALLAARAEGRIPDTLLLLEHPPVITLGRRAALADVRATPAALAARGIAVQFTNRGGLVTYHGPGQLVGYPIAALRPLTGGDVVRYVTGLEEVMCRLLTALGVAAQRDAQHHGVWVGAEKIGAVGVAVSRGVTMHGFALNLQPALDHFTLIVPCGLPGRGVTSVARLTGRTIPLPEAAATAARLFGAVFDRAMAAVPAAVLWSTVEAEDVHVRTIREPAGGAEL
ncbi:MAG: lipoyl(octanoyl) transferase LipB [Chloroflexi bacterium]|nr:lipoyl(octanoyl) transferase LipB [Chloroflexota bacterium]